MIRVQSVDQPPRWPQPERDPQRGSATRRATLQGAPSSWSATVISVSLEPPIACVDGLAGSPVSPVVAAGTREERDPSRLRGKRPQGKSGGARTSAGIVDRAWSR